MIDDKLPTRPVVTSRLAADAQMQHWLEVNQVKNIEDQDGSTWQLRVDVQQLPDPGDLHRPLWEITLSLSTALTAADCLATDVLSLDEDSRLVEMLGNAAVPLSMRPIRMSAHDIDEARNGFVAALERLKRDFPATNLREIKRRILSAWIENRCLFGNEGIRPE